MIGILRFFERKAALQVWAVQEVPGEQVHCEIGGFQFIVAQNKVGRRRTALVVRLAIVAVEQTWSTRVLLRANVRMANLELQVILC